MKTLVVVPVYNCEPVIHKVVKEILEKTESHLLVVDDGSDKPLQFDKPSRLSLVRHEKNQGKGVAIQTAMKWASEKGYSHILCIDGDGQHRAEDISLLLDKGEKFPQDMVIGSRIFDESVPGVSQFGRTFSNFWVKYQTGVSLTDTQSGLRLYPLEKLKDLYFFTGRYDFEIEILVRGLWSGVSVQEVNVGVIYPSKEDRISHFDKFWDNLRITGLNVLLVAYSLVFYQRSLLRVIIAGGVAFVASLFPTMFGGVVFGLFACVIFRLNAILVLLGITALYLV